MNALGVEVSAPYLKTTSMEVISNFLHERERYDRAVYEKNSDMPASKRIVPVTIKSSIAPDVL